MRIQLLSIGYELLIGKVVNTNATWLAAEATKRGHTVERIVCVGDSEPWIGSELDRALSSGAHMIITTGGLGPTFDDITAQAVAKALGRRLVLNEAALTMIAKKYESLGLNLTPERRKMAELPEGSTPLENPVGTAPGFTLVHAGTRVVCLPGVPDEMREMFLKNLDALLPQEGELFEENIRIAGIPESTLAPLIAELIRKNPYVYIKSHPKGSEGESIIELHVYTISNNPRVRELCSNVAEKLRAELTRLGGRLVD
ncbi:MAG: molybdopterin-binding protein [Thermoprotei archaeon]